MVPSAADEDPKSDGRPLVGRLAISLCISVSARLSMPERQAMPNYPTKGTKALNQVDQLTPEEINTYQRDGYLVPHFRLSEVDIDTLQRLTKQLVIDNSNAIDGIVDHMLLGAAARRPEMTKLAGAVLRLIRRSSTSSSS